MDGLRVIQWTTGKVGRLALRAILDDPRLELVGVYARPGEKVGKDAGALCGRPDTGIVATDDVEALVALGADTVIYAPFEADVDHVVRLLESGSDVISTNLFLNVGGIVGDVAERLEAACARGNSSFYVSGINPGWVNSVVAAMTAVCRQVDGVVIEESADCAHYESPETWLAMGMSMRGTTPEVLASARNWLALFRDAVQRIADALGITLEDMEFFCDFATASERVDLGWFVMEEGSNAAVRGGWRGMAGGRAVVTIQLTWYLTTRLEEGWTFDDDHYHVTVTGEPGVDMRLKFLPAPHWKHNEWEIMTALPAVSAAPDVKAARSGVLGLKDVGLPTAPVGAWLAAGLR